MVRCVVTYLVLKPGADSTWLKVLDVVLLLIRQTFAVTESALGLGVVTSELRVAVQVLAVGVAGLKRTNVRLQVNVDLDRRQALYYRKAMSKVKADGGVLAWFVFGVGRHLSVDLRRSRSFSGHVLGTFRLGVWRPHFTNNYGLTLTKNK